MLIFGISLIVVMATAFQIQPLNARNFERWKTDMRFLMLEKNCFDLVIGQEIAPVSGEQIIKKDDQGKSVEVKMPGASYKEINDFKIREKLALSLIYLNISEEYRPIIENINNAVDAWKTIDKYFKPDNRSHHMNLFNDLLSLKNLPGEKIYLFASRIKRVAEQIRSTGKPVEEIYLCYQLIRNLPNRYDTVVQNILRWGDEDFRMDKIISELTAEESRFEYRNRDSNIVRREALVTQNYGVICFKCNRSGHKANECYSREQQPWPIRGNERKDLNITNPKFSYRSNSESRNPFRSPGHRGRPGFRGRPVSREGGYRQYQRSSSADSGSSRNGGNDNSRNQQGFSTRFNNSRSNVNQNRDELKYSLQKYINKEFKPNLIKLIRFNERKGLIRARLAGAKLATGDVLIFLDSHCEANVQWLEPLLQRIKDKRDAVLCPIIDVIDDRTFEYYATNLEYFQIGGFTWNGHFTWIEIPSREENRKKTDIEPTRTPTMAGGLFAVERNYFWEVGSYDPGMEIWGGENLEMSFRVWMCGGTLEIVPCSHVGHIFRSFHPYKFPGNKDTHGINTARTVEVWMEDYKKYFYFHRPDLREIDYGDITHRLELKKKLKCKSFDWYLTEVYPEKFIFDKNVLAYGSVKNPLSKLCLDTLNRDEDKSEALGLYDCLGSQLPEQMNIITNQLLSLTKDGELRIEENCAELNDDLSDEDHTELPVIMTKCHGKAGNQKWSHRVGGPIVHVKTGRCIDVSRKKTGDDVVAKMCNGGHSQIWWFENYLKEPHIQIEYSPIHKVSVLPYG